MKQIYEEIIRTEKYKTNILYGKPRRGHDEGTVAAHIAELETNLADLVWLGRISNEDQYWKLKILIHTHDTFKAEARKDVPILDLDSHASLARQFLQRFCHDEDMLNIVQYHDLGYAIYRKLMNTGKLDETRLITGLNKITDLDLYLLFCIIDSCTKSKGREMIRWFVAQVNRLYPTTTVKQDYILPGPDKIGEVW